MKGTKVTLIILPIVQLDDKLLNFSTSEATGQPSHQLLLFDNFLLVFCQFRPEQINFNFRSDKAWVGAGEQLGMEEWRTVVKHEECFAIYGCIEFQYESLKLY